MINIPKYLSIGFLLIVFTNSYSQSYFVPGYIITNENDTIEGLVDYRGDIRNAKLCSFKPNEEATTTSYSPYDIKAYRYRDSKFYISKDLPQKDKDTTRLFVEYLVDGISDLYYYRDKKNEHYLIKKQDGTLVELTNEQQKKYVDGKEYLVNTNKHIGILKVTFSDSPEIQDEIKNAKLTHKSLISITKNYHNYVCDDEQCIVYEKSLPVFRWKFAPFVSIQASWASYHSPKMFSSSQFTSASQPTIGAFVEMSMPRINEKLSFLLSSEYGKRYHYSTFSDGIPLYWTYHEVHIKQTFLKNRLAFKYSYPDGKFRPTFSIGPGITYVMSDQSRHLEEVQNNTLILTYLHENIPTPNGNLYYNVNGSIGLDFYLTNNRAIFLNLIYSIEFVDELYIKMSQQCFGVMTGIYF